MSAADQPATASTASSPSQPTLTPNPPTRISTISSATRPTTVSMSDRPPPPSSSSSSDAPSPPPPPPATSSQPPPPPPPTTTTTTPPPPPPPPPTTSSSSSSPPPPPPPTTTNEPPPEPTPTPTSSSRPPPPPPPPPPATTTTRPLTQITSLIRVTSTAFSTSQVVVTIDGGRTSTSDVLVPTAIIQSVPTMIYVDESGNPVTFSDASAGGGGASSSSKPSATVVAMAIILPVALVAVLIAAVVVRRRHHSRRRLSFGMPLFRPSASGPGAGTSSSAAYGPLRPSLVNHAPTAAPHPPPMVPTAADASTIPLMTAAPHKAMLPPASGASPPSPPDTMMLPPLKNSFADPPMRTAGGPPPESYPPALLPDPYTHSPATPAPYAEPYADMFQSPPMHPATPVAPAPPTSPLLREATADAGGAPRPHVSRPIVGLATRPEVTSVVVRTAPHAAQVPAPQESPVSAAGMHARWNEDNEYGVEFGESLSHVRGTSVGEEGQAVAQAEALVVQEESELYLPESYSTVGTRSSAGDR